MNWFSEASWPHKARAGGPCFKVPTADLESDAPFKPDEDVHGVTYDEIDDFLEGRETGENTLPRILTAYRSTVHKRALPAAPIG